MTTTAEGNAPPSFPGFALTGVAGLDRILTGGLLRNDFHLVQGSSGTGKTTLALQFLLTGTAAGEPGLFLTLSQSKASLDIIARSHGWSLDPLTVHEIFPGPSPDSHRKQTVFHAAEVELAELTREIQEVVTRVGPRRVIFDSIGVIGLLAGSETRYRHEILLLRQFLARCGCTSMFIDEGPLENDAAGRVGSQFHSLAGSIVHLEQNAPDYGNVRRRLRVLKVRGVNYVSGYHNFKITHGGLEVFPRLEVTRETEYTDFQFVPSGLEPLDKLLGGGLELGTTAMFVGPPGAGKSTLSAVFLMNAARMGDRGAVFLFDERPETFKSRSAGVGFSLQPWLDTGVVTVHRVDAASITTGEFSHNVRHAVEDQGVKVVLIDSLTGYYNVMTDATMLAVQLHELITFLSRNGVLSILIVAQEGLMSVGVSPSVDVSYLSDAIIVFRQFEDHGNIRRCIAAIKKRQGEHETTIRELVIARGVVAVGAEPLREPIDLMRGSKAR